MMRRNIFWQVGEDIPKPLRWGLMIASISFPLLVWSVVAGSGIFDSRFLPTPVQVAAALQRLWISGDLAQDTFASLYRISIGFCLSIVFSIPTGVLMGTFPSIRALLEPMAAFLRYMPAPAFIPLLILYFGIEEEPKVLLILIGTFFFNALMVMDAIKFVPKELIETTYTLGGSRLQVLWNVICPYIVPNIIDTCRVNMAAAWQLVIVSELIAATEGLGRRITLAGRMLRTDEIFASLLVIGLIGLGIDLLCRLILRLACRWRTD